MTQDPWSRPTIDDLRRVLESIGKPNTSNNRANERLELSVPAEIKTPRGNTISSMTREISRTGIGLLHPVRKGLQIGLEGLGNQLPEQRSRIADALDAIEW